MGSKIIIGINDLATTNPELVAEWHPTKNNIRPCDISKGSTKKVWWLGKCGHEWLASPNDRTHCTHRISGCPYCAGKRKNQYTDLADPRKAQGQNLLDSYQPFLQQFVNLICLKIPIQLLSAFQVAQILFAF